MKNFFLSFIIFCAFFLTAFKVAEKYLEFQEPLLVDTRPAIEIIMPKLEAPKIEIDLKDHNSFLNKIGHYESSNDYSRVNRWGYMGKYQFHEETLKAVDINVSKKKFLSSPTLQEEAMTRLLTENKKTLKRFIKKYDGKVVHGVYVTESGILAAAHLGGAGNVMKWFRKGEDFKDANGTPITKYMRIFSGYNLNLE
jgi:hypothetical protein